jgi:hypothetical protein
MKSLDSVEEILNHMVKQNGFCTGVMCSPMKGFGTNTVKCPFRSSAGVVGDDICETHSYAERLEICKDRLLEIEKQKAEYLETLE